MPKSIRSGRNRKVFQTFPNIPIALIEAKENTKAIGAGLQQGLEYAETLDIPFVFSSNGDGFVFHDRTGMSPTPEVSLTLDQFPSPADLWARYRAWKGLSDSESVVALQDYFDDGSGKAPRYYQVNAVNSAIEAIAKGQDRVLLVMATGTGKTYTAFQIIWRLWKSGQKKRILFLADRNVLIDQTMVNDFRPFAGSMAKLSTQSKTIERADGTSTDLTLALDKRRRIDTSYEIYLGLYQAITGPDESQKLYREFSRDFFDLIVIDECHRGSAADDSQGAGPAIRGSVMSPIVRRPGLMTSFDIRYTSEDFPASHPASSGTLGLEWSDLVWAAITIGRPNVTYVFQHGDASIHEALFRVFMIKTALGQVGGSRRFQRTAAFKALDPTEKGAVSYFLGMAVCKLFASRLLNTPWLLHLDVFGSQLSAATKSGRSRPDLIGQGASGEWHAFETKGRSGMPSAEDKLKAKTQAERLVLILSKGPPLALFILPRVSDVPSDVLPIFQP